MASLTTTTNPNTTRSNTCTTLIALPTIACSECVQVTFSRKASLYRHMRETHKQSNTKSYQCGHCKRSFVRKATLRRHERTHTEPKRPVCLGCGLQFGRRSLEDHVAAKANHRCLQAYVGHSNANALKIHPVFQSIAAPSDPKVDIETVVEGGLSGSRVGELSHRGSNVTTKVNESQFGVPFDSHPPLREESNLTSLLEAFQVHTAAQVPNLDHNIPALNHSPENAVMASLDFDLDWSQMDLEPWMDGLWEKIDSAQAFKW